jgi:putative hydrolase of the HAD superfamily
MINRDQPLIDGVLFDFGQTLVDASDGFRMAERVAERRIFSHLGLSSWQKFLSDYRRIRKTLHSRSELSRASMWRAVYEHYGVSTNLAFLREWEDAYWETVKRETKPFQETQAVLSPLSQKYRLALITNTQGQRGAGEHRIGDLPGFRRFFEIILVAGESGLPAKPDPAPFLRCLEKMKISSSRAVYVGDDWDIDICGARAARIQPIWIQHESVRRNWPDGDGSVPVITSLHPLLRLEDLLSERTSPLQFQ